MIEDRVCPLCNGEINFNYCVIKLSDFPPAPFIGAYCDNGHIFFRDNFRWIRIDIPLPDMKIVQPSQEFLDMVHFVKGIYSYYPSIDYYKEFIEYASRVLGFNKHTGQMVFGVAPEWAEELKRRSAQ